MAKLQILPLGDEIAAEVGSTVMGSAQALGYYWPTTCGGEGRCTTCACEVVAGADLLVAMGRNEEATLVDERGPGVVGTGVRLACQAQIREDGVVVVRKPGVRRPL